MGKITGFMEYARTDARKRPVKERVRDYREFELPVLNEELSKQGARCMDCGVPFCNTGCPLGNLIPDWNDLVYRGDWEEASESLHSTNNFPEITGRVCPAPCEASCVLGINEDPVSIKLLEKEIAQRALDGGWVTPLPPRARSGKRVAIIGSGPAGLAAAQQLNRSGHQVVVYERDDRLGGLLTYGIPDFKLDKGLVHARVEQMQAEGVSFETGVNVGVDLDLEALRRDHDAIGICIGSRIPRPLSVPGSELAGVHFAMEFLEQQNRRIAGEVIEGSGAILATGKHVVVIGGGDTGSDCIGTSNRQGALSVTNFEIMPRPPDAPAPETPWPLWPLLMRSSSSHEEGVARDFAVSTTALLGTAGQVQKLRCTRLQLQDGKFQPIPGTEFEISADLVLLAMGFVHPERPGLIEGLGLQLTPRGSIAVDDDLKTNEPGVFAAGDAQRGQSLVVWAIADGRKMARAIDQFLMGSSELPTPRVAGLIR